jgi:hypothetical protein
MTIGASSNRDELVKTLRGMQFSKLDLDFLKGEDSGGKQKDGYDRYGKFKIRLGWGTGVILLAIFAIATLRSFFPSSGYSFDPADDPAPWLRDNLYWTLPIWLIAAYFLWRSNRKVVDESVDFLSKGVEKIGLVVLPGGTKFPGDRVNSLNSLRLNIYTGMGTAFDSAFALKYDNHIRVAFGLSSLWWDASSSVATNRGINVSQSLFVWVALPDLANDFVYLNPKNPPLWDALPAMNEKARASLTFLASKYAVVIGGGGIGVGLAKDSINGPTSTMRGNMTSPAGWQACYGLLSQEVADVVEGLK